MRISDSADIPVRVSVFGRENAHMRRNTQKAQDGRRVCMPGKTSEIKVKVLKALWAVELRDSGQFSPDIKGQERSYLTFRAK